MNLTNEQKMIQETAHKIAQQELAPKAAQVDRDLTFPADGLQQLAETGFLGMTIPEALGGGGADTLSFVLTVEAIAQGCASTALLFLTHGLAARALAAAGSDEQKSRLLPAMIRGERLEALAATEPDAGSNPLAIALKTKADGDDFVVNGSKVFVTAAEEAELYLVVLRTDQAKAPIDFSALVIEKGTPGFSFGKKDEGMGLRGISWGELVFEDCRVPRVNLLGAENGYLGVAMSFAGLAMVGTAAISLGIAQASVDAAIGHAKSREIAGQTIGHYQGIQFLLAEMSTALAAARALTYSSVHGQALRYRDGHRRGAQSPAGAWRKRVQPRVAVGALLSRRARTHAALNTVRDVERDAGQNARGDAATIENKRRTSHSGRFSSTGNRSAFSQRIYLRLLRRQFPSFS